jgi:hypothetical protein
MFFFVKKQNILLVADIEQYIFNQPSEGIDKHS